MKWPFGRPNSPTLPDVEGYLRVGSRYFRRATLLQVLTALLAAGLAYALVLHPQLMRMYYARAALPAFPLDSAWLAEYTGRARLLGADGAVLYEGPIAEGVVSGVGKVYADGVLRYDGALAENRFEGQGRLYAEDGSLRYQGGFSAGLFHGEGRLYQNGVPVYTGTFFAGVCEGYGKEYHGGALVYEGGFTAGKRDGDGVEYNPVTGVRRFAGRFAAGARTESGVWYDEKGDPIEAAPARVYPPDLLGLPAAAAEAALTAAGVVWKELSAGDRLLLLDESGGVIYAAEAGAQGGDAGAVREVYLCGLDGFGPVLVGGNPDGLGGAELLLAPIPSPCDTPAGQAALLLSNRHWGGSVKAGETEGRAAVWQGFSITICYRAPPPPELAEDGTPLPEPPGEILFLRLEVWEGGK